VTWCGLWWCGVLIASGLFLVGSGRSACPRSFYSSCSPASYRVGL